MAEQRRRGIPQGVPGRNLSAPSSRAEKTSGALRPNAWSGCHKSCEAWRQLQERQRVQRQQKKAYLDYYNDLCLTMTRQFRALSPCRMIR